MWLLFTRDLRRRWAEYLLGALAIALVVAALVTNRALTASADSTVHDLAHGLGKNVLVLPSGADLPAFLSQRYGPETLSADAPSVLRASAISKDIRAIEARLLGRASLRSASVIVVGEAGDWPASTDVSPAVLGPAAASATGLRKGQTFEMGGIRLAVSRVLDVAPDGLDDAVFMPLSAAQIVLGLPGQISALRLAGCWCRMDVAALAGEVETLLPGSRAITLAGVVRAQKGSVATMKRYSTVMIVVGLGIVAAIVGTLLAAQVRRRSREIGLLAAVGASPLRIGTMIVLQALAMGTLGAAGGWLASIPLLRYLGGTFVGAPLAPPADLLLLASLVVGVVSVLAAGLPARHAARLDPVVVLRES